MPIETGEFTTLGETGSGDIQAALLTAIARSTEDLTNGRGWPDGVNALLADLGRITKVSRVWIFQVLELTRDYIVQDYTFEWAARPEYVQIGLPYFSSFKKVIDQPEYRELIHSRLRGEYQKVLTARLAPSWLKSSQEEQRIKSMLTIPIYVENQWWGTLGFDDCEREYDWSDAEVALLRMAGFFISSAVLRENLSTKRKQLDILQQITTCSAWQVDPRRWQLWCTTDIFQAHPGKPENIRLSLRSFLHRVHREDRAELLNRIRSSARQQGFSFRSDIRISTEAKESRWIELTGKASHGPDQSTGQVAGIALDITVRKTAEERLRQEASTDPLTGVLNRRKLEQLLQIHVAAYFNKATVFSLLMLDLDHFKAVNDRHGHVIGDEILCHFTELCRSCLRKDDFLARVGGEEFAVLLPGTGIDKAYPIAERIRLSLKKNPFEQTGLSIPVTVSVGCATMKEDITDAAGIYLLADAALYNAKNSGRDRVVVAD